MYYVGCILLLLLAMAEATPPGIANHPAKASCKIKKYKMCYNLEHVCPKFCPDGCEVECASCKPICTSGSSGEVNPPSDDGGSNSETPPSSTPNPTPNTPSPARPSTPTNSPPPSSKPPSTPSTSPSSPSTPSKTPSAPSTQTPQSTPSTSRPSSTPSTPSSPSTTPSSPSTPTPSSTPSPPYSPPASGVASKKRVRCKNNNYPACYGQDHVCPANCPTSCEVDCVTCKPVCSCDYPGAVCQDPRFIGGDGITFYFHGKKDRDFCLVTDPNLHINAHFIGKRNENMTRDFTWVDSIGVLFDEHRLFIGALKTSTWDDAKDRLALSFDGEPIFLEETEGLKWESKSTPIVTIKRGSSSSTSSPTNNVMVEVEGKLKITAKVVPITRQESIIHNYGITQDDCFAHLDLGFKFTGLSHGVEGVLGKTYRDDYVSQVKMGVAMAVMGGEREYESSSLFATDCLASRFHQQHHGSSLEELASLSCVSGINGGGVICKR